MRRLLPRSCPRACAAFAFALLLHTAGANAQGFPGKGGGGGHHGGAGRYATTQPCASADAASGDALTGFFGTLHELRTELLIRDNQAPAWTAMRDALRTYVDAVSTEPEAPAQPLLRIKSLADSAQTRAAALNGFGQTMGALFGVLDDGQRRTLDERLGNALAAAPVTAH